MHMSGFQESSVTVPLLNAQIEYRHAMVTVSSGMYCTAAKDLAHARPATSKNARSICKIMMREAKQAIFRIVPILTVLEKDCDYFQRFHALDTKCLSELE